MTKPVSYSNKTTHKTSFVLRLNWKFQDKIVLKLPIAWYRKYLTWYHCSIVLSSNLYLLYEHKSSSSSIWKSIVNQVVWSNHKLTTHKHTFRAPNSSSKYQKGMIKNQNFTEKCNRSKIKSIMWYPFG